MDTGADSGAWDCVVVGAGPAGLNAALVLGRARRRVVVLDNAQPRNYATHEMHGVLGHDGLDPAELRARGRAELAGYGVEVVSAEVQDAEVLDGVVRLSSTRAWPSWPPAPAESTSPSCCASGPATSSCSATARTTSLSTSSRVCTRSASRSSRHRSWRW